MKRGLDSNPHGGRRVRPRTWLVALFAAALVVCALVPALNGVLVALVVIGAVAVIGAFIGGPAVTTSINGWSRIRGIRSPGPGDEAVDRYSRSQRGR